jgi:hypothetical protein
VRIERKDGEGLVSHVRNADARALPSAVVDLSRLGVGFALHGDHDVEIEVPLEQRACRLPAAGMRGDENDPARQ